MKLNLKELIIKNTKKINKNQRKNWVKKKKKMKNKMMKKKKKKKN